MNVSRKQVEDTVDELRAASLRIKRIICHVTEGEPLDFDPLDYDQRTALHQNLGTIGMEVDRARYILVEMLQAFQVEAQDDAA